MVKSSSNGISANDTSDYVFLNVFLPRKLLISLSPKLSDLIEQDLALIKLINNSLNSFSSRDSAECTRSKLSEITKTFSLWEKLQSDEFTNEAHIFKSLKTLNEGSSMALFIRSQNACLIIKRLNQPNDYYGTVSSFQVSATNTELMDSENDLISYYPSACFYIKSPDLLITQIFADQVSNLTDFINEESRALAKKQSVLVEESRDVPSPCLIIDWLLPILTAQSGEVKNCIRVVKKYRDDVMIQPQGQPFRRSGMWISLKAVLYIMFIEAYGENLGKALYKSVILESHLIVAELLPKDNSENILQAIKKLAKRCDKLSKLDLGKEWLFIYDLIIRTNKLIKQHQEDLNNELLIIATGCRTRPVELDISKLNNRNMKHDLTELRTTCKRLRYFQRNPELSSIQFSRNFLIKQISSFKKRIHFGDNEELDLWLHLYQFECFVRANFMLSHFDLGYILEILENYIAKALVFYRDDPLGYSRMTLTVLKILIDLDKLAVDMNPLLGEHKFGLDTESFYYLLIPKASDIAFAHSLFLYIESRNAAEYPSLINLDTKIKNNAASRLAASSYKMQAIKKIIIQESEKAQAEKMKKIRGRRKELNNHLEQINTLNCKYVDDYYGTIHYQHCERCYLRRCAMRLSETIYEHPLPKDPILCDLIMFELMIPQEIAVLRDALHVAKLKIFGFKTSGSAIRGKWTSYKPLVKYAENNQKYIFLGSTTELFSKSGYSRLVIANTPHDSEFFKPNGYNLFYCTENDTINYTLEQSPYKSCTFKLTDCYSGLQWTMNATEHSENMVIASLSKCPTSLMKTEYLKFGLLRSGHRLQLMNLLEAIESRGLSFKHESVYFLIAQTLWQLGPLNYSGSNRFQMVPESHKDMMDVEYLEALTVSTKELLDSAYKNWNDHIVLLVVITVIARAASMCIHEKMRLNIFSILRQARRTSLDWQRNLESSILNSQNLKETEIKALKEKLLEISCFTILTYNIDKDNQHFLINSTEDIIDWFTSLTKVHEYSILYSSESSSIFRKNLLRTVNLITSELEEYIDHIVMVEDGRPLTKFVNEKWADSKNGDISFWRKDISNYSYTAYFRKEGDNTDQVITIGKDGLFLIRGHPVGKLSKEIINHSLFKYFFKNTDFDVLPSSSSDNSYVTAKITISSNHNVSYEFTLPYENSSDLIVIERIEIDNETNSYQLIPSRYLTDILPELLVNEYSHWRNTQTSEIIFKKPSYTDETYHTSSSYILDFKSGLVKELSTGRFLININSQTFKEFTKKISYRLDYDRYVHMFIKDELITIDFPRLNLHFKIDQGEVISTDFRAMKVSKNQQIGTLFGLEQGLVITDDVFGNDDDKKKLIIPHGALSISKSEKDLHQVVKIDIETHKKPMYFLYDIDNRLKLLRAGESITAWLYLAWLHIATSHILADPFLGVTGTAMALNLLQSPHCWSCMPLSDDSVFILSEISKLSPDRTYSPEHLKIMQKVVWPECISSLSAHEGFIYLATLIYKDSQKIKEYESKNAAGFENKLNSAVNILMQKAYYRSYTGSLRLKPQFEAKFWNKPRATKNFYWKMDWSKPYINNCRTISTRSHPPSSKFSLKKALLSTSKVKGITGDKFEYRTVTEWLSIAENFYELWISIYNYCIGPKNDPIKLTFILSLFAYKGCPLGDLLFLQGISLNPTPFSPIVCPQYAEYEKVHSNNYDSWIITNILNKSFTKVDDYDFSHMVKGKFELPKDFLLRKGQEYDKEKEKQVKNAERLIYSKWPTEKIVDLVLKNFDKDAALCVNGIIFNWYKNWSLANFIHEVCLVSENTSSNVQRIKIIPFQTNNFTQAYKEYFSPVWNICFVSDDPYDILLRKDATNIFASGKVKVNNIKLNYKEKDRIISEFPLQNNQSDCALTTAYIKDLKQSWDAFLNSRSTEENPDFSSIPDLYSDLQSIRTVYKEKLLRFEQLLSLCKYQNSLVYQNYDFSNIFPSITPSIVLSILQKQEVSQLTLDQTTQDILGAISVLWTLDQRIIRCLNFLKCENYLMLSKELENQPYSNWSPREMPEWLILQIEQDIMIRRVQVEVARKMINPPNNTNTVMQLNMGEGKTAVIIPMIASTMANGTKLVRITVLKSLFNMNYNALAHKLGGALNRKIYVFPCRRDQKLSVESAKTIKALIEECMKTKGIIITLPEYRLSFVLKGLECSMTNKLAELSRNLVGTELWMRRNCRDILDESDEILNAKYQLVYTIGKQTQISAGSLRWKACQMVLNLARNHYDYISEKYGEDCVSYKPNPKYPMAFPRFRLLRFDAYQELCERICYDILKGRSREVIFLELKESQIQIVISFILSQSITSDMRAAVEKIIDLTTPAFDIITILRGLFTYQLFYMTLTKRWRVDYGVNLNNTYLKQAVPFRAKDVPADRAQYAHPDISILLTQLSYYYSGLSNVQLEDLFNRLEKEIDGAQEYERWIQSLPKSCKVDSSVCEYSGLNFSDTSQKYDFVFPLLRFHPLAINFWLNHFVYPREIKEFSGKIGLSAWDLCNETKHPMTGFSGTNDSKLLLPLTGQYYDIPELLGTNGSVIYNLLKEENNNYKALSADVTGIELLRVLTDLGENLRILLDAGALMIDLTNEETIKEWLKLRPDMEAGVFFDFNNDLMVIDRNNRVSSFDLSPYRHLENCLVYLDDAHTRGTDLKIPRGIIGALTLGKGVTKDKMMQACMRMRMLGNGHSIYFIASHEVNIAIQKTVSTSIQSIDVLKWAINNSRDHTVDCFLYWSLQGIAYYKKSALYDNFLQNKNLIRYSNLFIEKDTSDIHKLYSRNRLEEFITKVVENNSKIALEFLKSSRVPHETFLTNYEKIYKKCKKYIFNKKKFSHLLEEEQELELEVEQEEERELHKPIIAECVPHALDKDVQEYAQTGVFRDKSSSFYKITEVLRDTCVSKIIQKDAWGNEVYVTKDFVRTVKKLNTGDDFLKSPRWLVLSNPTADPVIVIFSGFEANQLLPAIAKGPNTFIMYMRRSRMSNLQFFTKSSAPIPQHLIQRISVFAGSQYFASESELSAYLDFIGFSPGPRSPSLQAHFENGLILPNGYTPPESRATVFPASTCKFNQDPSELISKLCEIRNYGAVSKFAHTLEILSFGRMPSLPNRS